MMLIRSGRLPVVTEPPTLFTAPGARSFDPFAPVTVDAPIALSRRPHLLGVTIKETLLMATTTAQSTPRTPISLIIELDSIASKRRTRAQLERARNMLEQLEPWRTTANDNVMQDIVSFLDDTEDAMDCADDAFASAEEKKDWREEADTYWEGFGYAIEELAEFFETPEGAP